MGRYLLVYDVDWWILGYKARMIKKFHNEIEILSQHDLKGLIAAEGAKAINARYDVISTLSVGIAAYMLKKNIRVDSSQVGGYNYFAQNIDTYREWCDEVIPNKVFITKVLDRIDRLGAISDKP